MCTTIPNVIMFLSPLTNPPILSPLVSFCPKFEVPFNTQSNRAIKKLESNKRSAGGRGPANGGDRWILKMGRHLLTQPFRVPPHTPLQKVRANWKGRKLLQASWGPDVLTGSMHTSDLTWFQVQQMPVRIYSHGQYDPSARPNRSCPHSYLQEGRLRAPTVWRHWEE